MADKKIAASLVNVIKFDIDRASMQRAMKAIKDVKKAMEGVYKPFIDAQKHMKKAQAIQAKSLKQKSDSLIVQKALDKREAAQLKQAEKLANIKIKQAAAEKKMHQEARRNAIAGLTGSGGSKASGTALADLLRQEDAAYRARRKSVLDARASANKARQQRKNMEMGLMHSEGLYMNRMFDRQQKQSAASNKTANKFTSRREADQFFFRSKFGRGGERRFNQLAQEFSAGGMSSQMYASKLRILRSELYANQRAQRGFNDSIRDMRSAFIAATASYTAFAGVMGIANTGKQFEAQRAQMLVASGDQKTADSQLSYLNNEIYRLGLGRQQASQGYSQIAMAGQKDLGVGGVNRLFTGLSELATATKLDPFKYEKVVNAMGQMLSKKQIYAEEYQGQ